MYVFVLCPPFCGSTLLWKILCSSPSVAQLPNEGQFLPEVKEYLREDPWGAMDLPWERIKAVWELHWDQTKPLKLEKSPPNLIRVVELQAHFAPVKFIVMVRNPYAQIEGLLRRGGDIGRATRFAMRCLRVQMNNAELHNSFVLTYEQLVSSTDGVCRSIEAFLPELGPLQHQQQFSIKGQTRAIVDLNTRQILRLSTSTLRTINEHIDPEVLAYWGYEPYVPDGTHGLKRLGSKTSERTHKLTDGLMRRLRRL